MFTPLFRLPHLRALVAIVLAACMHVAMAGTAVNTSPMLEQRQQEANDLVEQWNAQELFWTPVRASIKPINPNSEAASSQHETFFQNGNCNIVVYVDPVRGAPLLPGIAPLQEHEHTFAFETVVMHELSHCAHFARPLRYDNPLWSNKHNEVMSVQMVMAQQMYNETRFVDAHMEHVADAYAAVRMRMRYNDNGRIGAFLAKYVNLREHWHDVVAARSGTSAYLQHATQHALHWALAVDLHPMRGQTPVQWLDDAVQAASITSLATAKSQVAWGGLGALLCATSANSNEWSSTAANALARIASNDITFLPPGPWRMLALDFDGAVNNMESNQKVFGQTEGLHALQDLDDLRIFMTQGGKDPIPLDGDNIGKPEGLIPLDLAVGAPVVHGVVQIRQANGCVAVNPKH